MLEGLGTHGTYLPKATLFNLFWSVLRRPMAPELPMWEPETSVRRRFSCSSRTSSYLPVLYYVARRNVKHNGRSKKRALILFNAGLVRWGCSLAWQCDLRPSRGRPVARLSAWLPSEKL